MKIEWGLNIISSAAATGILTLFGYPNPLNLFIFALVGITLWDMLWNGIKNV